MQLIERDFQLMVQVCQDHEGQMLKSLGDGLMMYFASAENAVRCAIAIQTMLTNLAAELPPSEVLKHRIGVHIGDVLFKGQDVMGTGVNIAARLQGQAPAGGVCMSQAVYELVRGRISAKILNGGLRQLKGIQEPIRVFLILPLGTSAMRSGQLADRDQPLAQRIRKRLLHPPSLVAVLVSSFVTLLLVSSLRHGGFLQQLELQTFDQLLRLRPAEKTDHRILLITIDETDLQSYPRDRSSLADPVLNQLLQKLETYQPRIIGLDIYRDFPADPNVPDLEQRLRQTGALVAVCKGDDLSVQEPGIPPPPEVPLDRVGFSDFIEDPDGLLRRQILFMMVDLVTCNAPYAFSVQLAFRYLDQEGIQPEFTPDRHLKLGPVVFPALSSRWGGYQGIDPGGSQVVINYRSGNQPFRQVALRDVLNDRVNPKLLENRIILIGVTAKSAGDYWATPLGSRSSEQLSGVIVQAHMVSQILAAVLDDRPLIWAWAWQWELVWIWFWGGFAGLVAVVTRSWRSRLGLILLASGSLIGLGHVFLLQGGWIPLVPPLLNIGLTGGLVLFYLRWQESPQRRFR